MSRAVFAQLAAPSSDQRPAGHQTHAVAASAFRFAVSNARASGDWFVIGGFVGGLVVLITGIVLVAHQPKVSKEVLV